MTIYTMIEPEFMGSHWCMQALSGLESEAKRKKYDIFVLDGKEFNTLNYDMIFGNAHRLLIVIGSTKSWIFRLLKHLEANRIHAILLSFDIGQHFSKHSMVCMNYPMACLELLGYLYHYGREEVALCGVNKNSSSDCTVRDVFSSVLLEKGVATSENHIYYNCSDIQECCAQFMKNYAYYNAVICSNDILAVHLIKELVKSGVRIPEQMMIVAIGESMLSHEIQPSLTTMITHHFELGRQAVKLYAFLYRQETNINASIRVKCHLDVAETTGNLPFESISLPLMSQDQPVEAIDFYQDPEVQDLFRLDHFYYVSDDLDREILRQLAENIPIDKIAENCFSTISTIGYRIRTMKARVGVSSKEELLEKLNMGLHGKIE